MYVSYVSKLSFKVLMVCFYLCLDGNCSNESLSVEQSSEAVSASSENTHPDTYKLEATSSDYQPDQQHIEHCDNAEKQRGSDNVSELSQSQSKDRTASATFYFRPGSNCYESFGDVVRNANKTSK